MRGGEQGALQLTVVTITGLSSIDIFDIFLVSAWSVMFELV